MSQSPRASLVEAVANVTIGYVVAVATQAVAFPMFGVDVPASSHLGIGAIFVAVSLVRSYVLRRIFNRWRS